VTEEEARSWVRASFGVSCETQLAEFAALIVEENLEQNLIAPSTIDQLWSRHIVDSAQLLAFAGAVRGLWLDIGTGGGFPGLVIACLSEQPIVLCEPRRRRAEFLRHVAARLSLAHARVEQCRVESLPVQTFSVISARAVSALPALFDSASRLSDLATTWLLPKGKTAREEVVAACKTWHGTFHVKHSLTQSGSLIIVARGVARK
jgi:16S rRNA (guanine527-N7)-methyltransferase